MHHDDYMTDLTICLQNVFEFSEYSCEDMRERVQERIQMLNGKSEKETEKIEQGCNKFAERKQMEMAN